MEKLKLHEKLTELYDRYGIADSDREYTPLSEVRADDPLFLAIESAWAKLSREIPEIKVFMTAPTLHDEVRREFKNSLA